MREGGELSSNPGGHQNFCWRLVLHGTVGPARWRAQKQSSGIMLARAEALEFQFFCSRAVEASLRPRFFFHVAEILFLWRSGRLMLRVLVVNSINSPPSPLHLLVLLHCLACLASCSPSTTTAMAHSIGFDLNVRLEDDDDGNVPLDVNEHEDDDGNAGFDLNESVHDEHGNGTTSSSLAECTVQLQCSSLVAELSCSIFNRIRFELAT